MPIMNNLKNPILNFRLLSKIVAPEEIFSYDLVQGKHAPVITASTAHYNAFNTCTMITLTREAADSSENSGQ
jgi:hypothetical protein